MAICFINSSSISITVGTNIWNSGGQTYNISGNITHPEYDPSLVKNDIGFLIVATDVSFSKSVQLVVLSYQNIGADIEAIVAGWGRVNVSIVFSIPEKSKYC